MPRSRKSRSPKKSAPDTSTAPTPDSTSAVLDTSGEGGPRFVSDTSSSSVGSAEAVSPSSGRELVVEVELVPGALRTLLLFLAAPIAFSPRRRRRWRHS